MKKILIFTITILLFFNIAITFWASWNTTIIDCLWWDDLTWESFNTDKPYRSLKIGIENTISYINTNINKTWNEQSASWQIFNIKVNCTMKQMLDNTIKLDFLGNNYNNELIIEGSGSNSLIFQDIKLLLSYNAWNITFKNAKFDNYSFPYFYDYFFPWDNNKIHPSSSWIKIVDSYIKIWNWLQIWSTSSYKLFTYYYYPSNNYAYYYHYSNQQYIDNSIIDISMSWNYSFNIPAKIKNSKINFINNSWSLIYDILFIENWNINSATKFNFSNFISNEIDLWWNNFSSESSNNIAYINNKFTNFNNFILWKDTIYLNNSIENNTWTIDITWNKNTYNNLFSWNFIDSFDLLNLRKNFNISNIWAMWIAWVFKKINTLKYFNIDTSSNKLYTEVTGQTIPKSTQSIYITY